MSPTKRKAGALSGGETPESKRRWVPSETPESVREAGTALLTQLKNARDKRNRSIVTHFMTLPDKDQHPDYYKRISLPLSIEILQNKLDRLQYTSLSELESDLKRLISNAKSYNARNSEAHSDAEKVRKLASTNMQKVNPAYADRNYVAVATPLPEELNDVEDEDSEVQDENGPDDEGSKPTRQRLTLPGPSVKSQDNEEAAESPLDDEQEDDATDKKASKTTRQCLTLHGPSEKSQTPSERTSKPDLNFVGKTFQTAQEAIVQALMSYEDKDGLNISAPFINLPPRDMKEYYQVIKQPVSLKAVHKSVRGIKGRDKPTGASFYKYWQSFEDEVQRIWDNARTFNEDESEIVHYAAELEVYFKDVVSKAKQAVPGPPAPHITLRVKDPGPSPKIKISLGPKPATQNANGFAVDPEALRRQSDTVRAGAHGSAATGANGVSSPQVAQAKSASPSSAVDGVRARSQSGAPGLRADGTTPAAAGSSADLSMQDGSEASDHRAASTSMPLPSARLPPSHANSPQPTGPPMRPPLPPDLFQSRRREPDKGLETALIQEVRLYTPSDTSVPHFQKLRILPNPHTTHNGIHTYLDRRQTNFVLEVRPHRPEPGRVYSFSVHVNDAPVPQAPRPPPGADAAGQVWVLTLDSNYPVTQRIHVLCSSTIGRGLSMGTVEDRELRWFHIDYWPS